MAGSPCGCAWQRRWQRPRQASFVPEWIFFWKLTHDSLVSKYKNTLLWIKMYTVENFSMHSQGYVWKRGFSRAWDVSCVQPGWVHESEKLRNIMLCFFSVSGCQCFGSRDLKIVTALRSHLSLEMATDLSLSPVQLQFGQKGIKAGGAQQPIRYGGHRIPRDLPLRKSQSTR